MHDRIAMLYKRGKASEFYKDDSEGEHPLLYSNKWGIGSPSLQFLDTSADDVSEEQILEYLAQIIISIHYNNLWMNNTQRIALSIVGSPQKSRLKKEIV
jgi:hypothetical protein